MDLEVNSLSDAELRKMLIEQGVDVGPVTSTTRSVYEKKLAGVLSSEVEMSFQQEVEETHNEIIDQTPVEVPVYKFSTPHHHHHSEHCHPSVESLKRRPLYTPGGSTVTRTFKQTSSSSFKQSQPLKNTGSKMPSKFYSWCRFLFPLLLVVVLLVLLVYYHMEHNAVKKLPTKRAV